MEEKNNYYDVLCYELFEILIPQMLYKGTIEEKNTFFQLLLQENKKLIRDMYKTLCEDDGHPYPYETEDFETEQFERGGVDILQIILPLCNPEGNSILRAYVLFSKRKNGKYIKKYFVIKRFDDGEVYIIHFTPKLKGILREELTEHLGDMEYEYWRLVREYAKIVVQDMRTGGVD